MRNRLVELDYLRGISVIGMIIILVPGSWEYRYDWLNHAAWRGVPLSDMIFPTFLFCVGFSIALVFRKKMTSGQSKLSISKSILIRSFLLILIGLAANYLEKPDLDTLRIPGVLQRIGVCYLLVNLIIVSSQGIMSKKHSEPYVLIVVAVLIVFLYWMILNWIQVAAWNVYGYGSVHSWPTYLDRQVFGIDHLWMWGTTDSLVTYDPEGILSTLPACINVILGAILGFFHLDKGQTKKPLLLILGSTLMITAWCIDLAGIDPMIKKIWTSSFALYSGGFSITLFALIKASLKIHGFQWVYYPAQIFGSNALLSFLLALLSGALLDPLLVQCNGEAQSVRTFGFQFISQFTTDLKLASLLFALIFLGLTFVFLIQLYKRNRFVRV